MTEAWVDTDVLIRLLTGDDPEKQAASAALFERAESGDVRLLAPETVIADAVYVLASPRLYRVDRVEVAAMLASLVRRPGFLVQGKQAVLRALDLYASSRIDFGDALLIASMEQSGRAELYSYDSDFDLFGQVRRLEP